MVKVDFAEKFKQSVIEERYPPEFAKILSKLEVGLSKIKDFSVYEDNIEVDNLINIYGIRLEHLRSINAEYDGIKETIIALRNNSQSVCYMITLNVDNFHFVIFSKQDFFFIGGFWKALSDD